MDDLIRRAREALVDVTPGPWSYNSMGEFGPAYDDDYQAFGMICDPVGECDWPNAVDNARFIAAARDLVPAMADRIEAQEALLKEAMAAMEDARQSLVDSAEEIVELRLTLSKTDFELPWLSDAIDKQTIALAKLRAHLEDKE